MIEAGAKDSFKRCRSQSSHLAFCDIAAATSDAGEQVTVSQNAFKSRNTQIFEAIGRRMDSALSMDFINKTSHYLGWIHSIAALPLRTIHAELDSATLVWDGGTYVREVK